MISLSSLRMKVKGSHCRAFCRLSLSSNAALISCWMAACPLGAAAQWEDVSTAYLLDASCTGSFLGDGMSCADFNGDGLDDLTFAQASGTVSLYARTPDGFELEAEFIGEGQATSVLWVDVDGDGDLDLFIGHRDQGLKLYIRGSSGALLDESVERGMPNWPGWRPRGISACDFDHDHDLDIYVASYHITLKPDHYPNAFLINDGTGHFVLADDSVGVNDGVQTSFHGGWLDYDRDGWQDLWVINDRASFVNALYRNQGDGTFVDMAPALGLDIYLDPMTATIFDPDQDGDWDLFSTDVANFPHLLFEQTDSGFVETAAAAGVDGVYDYGWGGCVVDVDGDANEDLMVATLHWPSESTVDNRLYMGQDSGLYFVEDSAGWPNEQFPLYHLGRFDLDSDRAPDIVGFGAMPIAQLLHNTNAGGASRMTIKLVGTTANSHAVGALIEVYGGGHRQMQQVDAGTDYVTQHSYTRFFGLDTAQTVDSVVVTWPAGVSETWYGLEADTAHTLIQGTAGLAPVPLDRICPWDPQGWLVPFDPDEVEMHWHGLPVTSDTVWMAGSSLQLLEATWWNGAYGLSWMVSAEMAAVGDPQFELNAPVCFGESAGVSWSDPNVEAVIWMDSLLFPSDTALQVTEEVVQVAWQYGPACWLDTVVEVAIPAEILLDLTVDLPVCYGDMAVVEYEVTGGHPPLNVDWFGADPGGLPTGVWDVLVVDSAGCALSDSVVVVVPDSLESEVTWFYVGDSDSVQVAIAVSGGVPPYNVLWSGGVDAEGLFLAPGTVGWLVEDEWGCLNQGVLQLGVNSAFDEAGRSANALRCWRVNGTVGFDGPIESGHIHIYDLMGRQLHAGGWSTATRIALDTAAPVIVHITAGSDVHHVFFR